MSPSRQYAAKKGCYVDLSNAMHVNYTDLQVTSAYGAFVKSNFLCCKLSELVACSMTVDQTSFFSDAIGPWLKESAFLCPVKNQIQLKWESEDWAPATKKYY